MILQALTEYYQALETRGEIAAPGWGESRISFALSIDSAGDLKRVFPSRQSRSKGKRQWRRPSL